MFNYLIHKLCIRSPFVYLRRVLFGTKKNYQVVNVIADFLIQKRSVSSVRIILGSLVSSVDKLVDFQIIALTLLGVNNFW